MRACGCERISTNEGCLRVCRRKSAVKILIYFALPSLVSSTTLFMLQRYQRSSFSGIIIILWGAIKIALIAFGSFCFSEQFYHLVGVFHIMSCLLMIARARNFISCLSSDPCKNPYNSISVANFSSNYAPHSPERKFSGLVKKANEPHKPNNF